MVTTPIPSMFGPVPWYSPIVQKSIRWGMYDAASCKDLSEWILVSKIWVDLVPTNSRKGSHWQIIHNSMAACVRAGFSTHRSSCLNCESQQLHEVASMTQGPRVGEIQTLSCFCTKWPTKTGEILHLNWGSNFLTWIGLPRGLTFNWSIEHQGQRIDYLKVDLDMGMYWREHKARNPSGTRGFPPSKDDKIRYSR